MLVTEHAEAAGKRFDLKVFATDAQEINLRKARDGIYPAAALAGFPASRLVRFFEKLDGSYQVSKELRDMVIFAPQNLLRDPPFSQMDLVTCRISRSIWNPTPRRRSSHFVTLRCGKEDTYFSATPKRSVGTKTCSTLYQRNGASTAGWVQPGMI